MNRDTPITSRHNPRVKAAVLLRQRRHREMEGRLLVDGVREIRRAVEGRVELEEVFVCPETLPADAESLVAMLESTRADVLAVTEAVLEKIAFGDRSEGLVAVARAPRTSLADLDLPANPLIAVLEGIEKPGNLGAVVRTADAAGVAAVVVAGGTDLYNPNAVRASLGTIFTLPVCAAPAEETLTWLRGLGANVFAARPDAQLTYAEVDLRGSTAIVLGSEAAGLSDLWSGADVRAIRLPMHGAADSLNVAATAAVLFYEALRQRTA